MKTILVRDTKTPARNPWRINETSLTGLQATHPNIVQVSAKKIEVKPPTNTPPPPPAKKTSRTRTRKATKNSKPKK